MNQQRYLVAAVLAALGLFGPHWMPAGGPGLGAIVSEFDDKLSGREVPQAMGQEAVRQTDLSGAKEGLGNVQITAPVIANLQSKLPFLASRPEWDIPGLIAGAQSLWLSVLPRLSFWMWLLPALCFGLGLAGLFADQAGWVRSSASFGESIAGPWLSVLALSAVALALITRSNPWAVMPAVLYVPPLLWLTGSAWLLQRIDLNYPVWNTLVGGLAAPPLSMGAALILPRLLSYIP